MNRKDIIYVTIQFILFLVYVILPSTGYFNFPSILIYLGLIIFSIGLIILTLALLQLNKNLSPFPAPKTNGQLLSNGVYKWMRHPIYSGIILFTFGYAIYSKNEYRLMISVALFALFYFKSKYEEELLQNKFPTYNSYQQITSRFFPFI
jgi:protein-S-isoprenylcysteine O-methyltransferase Ste14